MDPRTIHRPRPDGTPDDFFVEGVSFRMENMDENRWWLAVYRGHKRVSIFLESDTPIACHIAEDELGLTDDR
jgi:hypothetical protein